MMSRRAPKGFTLIEVLVVIGIVAVFAGIVGAGLRTNSSAVHLQSAQPIVASMLEAARTTAQVKHARVALVVDADLNGDGFLRRIRIAKESAPNSGVWQVGSVAETLPDGIFVVPGSGVLNGVEFSEGNGAWTEALRSSLRLAGVDEVAASPDAGVASFLVMARPFEESGTTGAGADMRWVLAAGRRSGTGVTFANPLAVRGVILGTYGIEIPVDDAANFEF